MHDENGWTDYDRLDFTRSRDPSFVIDEPAILRDLASLNKIVELSKSKNINQEFIYNIFQKHVDAANYLQTSAYSNEELETEFAPSSPIVEDPMIEDEIWSVKDIKEENPVSDEFLYDVEDLTTAEFESGKWMKPLIAPPELAFEKINYNVPGSVPHPAATYYFGNEQTKYTAAEEEFYFNPWQQFAYRPPFPVPEDGNFLTSSIYLVPYFSLFI